MTTNTIRDPNSRTPAAQRQLLESLGFVRATARYVPDSVVVSVFGWEASGKSSIAASGPGFSILNSFDRGEHRATNRLIEMGRDNIHTLPIHVPSSVPDPKSDWMNILDDWEDKYDTAVEGVDANFIIDTTTRLYRLIRLAYFDGRLEKVIARKYGDVNARLSGIIDKAKDAHRNLILVSEAKAEWGPTAKGHDEPTGRNIRDANKIIGFACDFEIEARCSRTGVFTALTHKSGNAPHLTGETWGGKDRPHELFLPWLIAEHVPGSTPGTWGETDPAILDLWDSEADAVAAEIVEEEEEDAGTED